VLSLVGLLDHNAAALAGVAASIVTAVGRHGGETTSMEPGLASVRSARLPQAVPFTRIGM